MIAMKKLSSLWFGLMMVVIGSAAVATPAHVNYDFLTFRA
jgi:hypothetical protein